MNSSSSPSTVCVAKGACSKAEDPTPGKKIKREGSGWRRELKTRAASSVAVTGKSNGARRDQSAGLERGSTGAGRQAGTQMTREDKKKENRLRPRSSIWPGQIRRQHSGIYQARRYRCITLDGSAKWQPLSDSLRFTCGSGFPSLSFVWLPVCDCSPLHPPPPHPPPPLR